MKIKERFSITKRGYLLIHKLVPGYILFISIQAFCTAFLPLINIYFSGLIITAISNKKPIEATLFIALITVVTNLLVGAVNSAVLRRSEAVGGASWKAIKQPLNEKSYTMDYSYIENPKIQQKREYIDLLQWTNGLGLGRLIWTLESVLTCFFSIILSSAMVIGAFVSKPANYSGGLSFLFSPWTSVAVALIVIVCVLLDMLRMSRSVKKQQSAVRGFEAVNRLSTYYRDNIAFNYKGGKDLKLYKMEDMFFKDINSMFSELCKKVLVKLKNILAYYDCVGAAISTPLTAVIYIYVALKALLGSFGVGAIVQYAGALGRFGMGVSGFMSNFTMIWVNCDALKEYFDYVDMPDVKYQGSLPVEKRLDNEYEIEFHNVSFKYPESESYALKDLSLKLKIGEKMAVVGRNGSGKTTMIKLLCRLYDPTEGYITLNGIDIKKYDYNEYLSIFSVVFQDFKLFAFSLGQNVAASVEVDRDRAISCLDKAGFSERLATLSDGLDTPIYKNFDENGVEVSGGEAQKIALARALYKDAPFIILDEPTAALDPVAEYEVYSRFNKIVSDKTTIYISHRLSSCRFCENIAVFEDGRLIQHGSHSSLIVDQDGCYSKLWNAQAQYYE